MSMDITPKISHAASTVATVANEFLRLGYSELGFPPIDQMKLQKLLFYAHAWHLAIYDQPLFDTTFEAWPWGPVIRDVYFQTKEYRNGPVKEDIREMRKRGNDSESSDFSFVAPEPMQNGEVKDFIKRIWDIHKAYTGIQLSNSTHASNEPWTIVRQHYNNLDDKPTIPNDLIAAVFKRKLGHARTKTDNITS